MFASTNGQKSLFSMFFVFIHVNLFAPLRLVNVRIVFPAQYNWIAHATAKMKPQKITNHHEFGVPRWPPPFLVTSNFTIIYVNLCTFTVSERTYCISCIIKRSSNRSATPKLLNNSTEILITLQQRIGAPSGTLQPQNKEIYQRATRVGTFGVCVAAHIALPGP